MHEMDEKCRKCKNNGMAICNRCDMYYDEFDPIDEPKQTNADRIRSMSDEELAAYYFTEFFKKVPYCHENCPAHDDCQLCLLDWLREECK